MTDETRNQLKIRLQYWRLRRAMNIRELASKSHVSGYTISKIERGYIPQPNVIRRLAEALGITVEEMWEPVPEAEGKNVIASAVA